MFRREDADICTAFAKGEISGKRSIWHLPDEFEGAFQKVMVLVKNVRTMDISMLLDCIRER